MTADTAELHKVDSAVGGVGAGSPPKEKGHRRSSSSSNNVFNINDLEAEKKEISISRETQGLGWKINTSPTTIEDKEALKKPLCTPMIKKIDLHFKTGLSVTARNMKGVTIKDALDAIYKQCKKKPDDELDEPYLKGFEWDKDESWTAFIIHQSKEAGQAPSSKKSKKKAKGEADE